MSIHHNIKMHIHGLHRNSLAGDSSPECEVKDREALLAKRSHVLSELLDTERVYVTELESIIKGYKHQFSDPDMQQLIPIELAGNADILFGNLEDIYTFHSTLFLQDLENCLHTPDLIGLCFVQRKESLHRLYTTYCQNKPQSESLRREVGDTNAFFKECQLKLGHKLPLGAYLLKPVQRITKYQLLIKDLLKCCVDGAGVKELQDALDTMLAVLKTVNDSMHQMIITGYNANLSELGNLLMQGPFNMWTEHKRDRLKDLRLKPMRRHIFLYEQAVLFCKLSGKDPKNVTYQFKHCLKMSQVGLTETVHGSRGDRRKFELWLQGRQEVYTIQAPSLEVKEAWVREIKRVLLQQLEHLKGESVKIHATKVLRLSSVNGTRAVALNKRLRHHSSWDQGQIVRPPNRSLDHPGEEEDQDDCWSSEESDDEDPFDESNEISCRFVALTDYHTVNAGEVALREGDIVELIKVGCGGWWFIRQMGGTDEGWAPATYLERLTRKSSKSSPSASSQDSVNGFGMRHATSKSSVTSGVSITSQGETCG